VYVYIVLLTSWKRNVTFKDYYDLLEFFGGVMRIARLASMSGFTTTAVDVAYDDSPKSCMDINGNAGFVLLSSLSVINCS
jgi:hypothetical protein